MANDSIIGNIDDSEHKYVGKIGILNFYNK